MFEYINFGWKTLKFVQTTFIVNKHHQKQEYFYSYAQKYDSLITDLSHHRITRRSLPKCASVLVVTFDKMKYLSQLVTIKK